MSRTQSRPLIDTKTWAFEDFMGLDSSRDITSLDTGKSQHLARIENATCDWRGQIKPDPALERVAGSKPVTHVRFYDEGALVFAEQDGDGLRLRSDRGHVSEETFEADAILSSATFNRAAHFAARNARLRFYDGANFQLNRSPSMSVLRPVFMAAVQRRLAVAGITGRETEVHISRVDNAQVFPGDEAVEEVSVLRAGVIDVANMLGTADRITGLAAYEQDKLVVFTHDQAIIYRMDPDIDQWKLDENVNIKVGCAAHNTITSAGTDLLFCSRRGIHSIRRSTENGILVSSVSISDKVDLLYEELFDSVDDPSRISAVFDQDRAQYHVFFPQPGGVLCKRLTVDMTPEDADVSPKFATGSFLNARCGAFLGGDLVFGTTGGVYRVLNDRAETTAGRVRADADIVTPLLWHGSLHDEKTTHSILLQCSGRAIIEMTAEDENGRNIGSLRFEVDRDSDDRSFTAVPLAQQYERPWQRRYRAASYRFRILQSQGVVRFVGFAIKTRKM